MIEQETKEKTYTLAVKLKTLPLYKFKTNGEVNPPHEIFNYRSDYHTSDRAEVRRSFLTEVSSSVYKMVQGFTNYYGEPKPMTAKEIKVYVDKFDDLRLLANYDKVINTNTGKSYLIFTHNNKYTGNYSTVYKMVNQFNMNTSNHNLLQNAIIVDMDEFMRFYNDIKDEWQAQDNLKEKIREETRKITNLISKDKNLDKAIKEVTEKLNQLISFDDYNISDEVLEHVRIYSDKNFLRNLDAEFVNRDYNEWDALYDKYVRKLEKFKRVVSNDYYNYARRDFNITLEEFLEAQKYIRKTLENDSLYPLVSHPFIYNHKESEYATVKLHHLPALDDYCARLAELNTLLQQVQNKQDEMKRYYLSRLNYKSHLIVCDVNSETLITKGEEE
jgi:hypothetical protein